MLIASVPSAKLRSKRTDPVLCNLDDATLKAERLALLIESAISARLGADDAKQEDVAGVHWVDFRPDAV